MFPLVVIPVPPLRGAEMKVRMKESKRCRHYSAPHLPICPQSFSATAGAASESPSPGGFRLLGFLVFSPEQPKVTAPPPQLEVGITSTHPPNVHHVPTNVHLPVFLFHKDGAFIG